MNKKWNLKLPDAETPSETSIPIDGHVAAGDRHGRPELGVHERGQSPATLARQQSPNGVQRQGALASLAPISEKE